MSSLDRSATKHSSQYVSPLHLLDCVLNEYSSSADSANPARASTLVAEKILEAAQVSAQALREALSQALAAAPKVADTRQKVMSDELFKVLAKADKFKREAGDSYVSIEAFLSALSTADAKFFGPFLKRGGKDLAPALSEFRARSGPVTSKAAEASYDSLGKYCVDFTQLAREGKLDPVIGRDSEVRRAVQILSRRSKNNPVLIGEPGTGKTAIAEGIAQRIVAGDVPDDLRDSKLMSLDMGSLIAGAQYR